jgi:N-acetyltransferase
MSDDRPVDWQPTLVGESITLRPIASGDFDALHAAAADPLIWALHPDPRRHEREVFESAFFATALASRGALVVIDNATGRIIGSSRYYDWEPRDPSVAIGYTFLARSHWGGATNREMKRLMLGHAFQWADVVWFHVGKHNLRSRRAMEKLGAELSHEGVRDVAGVGHDYLYYRITTPGRELGQ